MRVLGIESTEARGGVAVVEDGRLLAEELLEEDRVHGRLLVPLARRALEKVGWTARDLDLVAVDRGPGSYTGIRIGIALAKSLSLALDLPVAGMDRFDLVARAAERLTGRFAPVLDTRRGHVACAFFERSAAGAPARRTGEDESTEPEALARAIVGPTILFGSGAEAHRGVFQETPGVSFESPDLLEVRPATVALAALDVPPDARHKVLPPSEADGLVPLYLRPTAAEEKRISRE